MDDDTTPTSAPATTRPGAARRRHLVAATARLAGRNGIAGTSVKDIARAAGVAPGLVHYYFTSKEELVLAVVGKLEEELQETWRRGVESASDPLERLIAGIDAVSTDADEHPEHRRLLAELALLSLTSPDVQERCAALWRSLIALIEHELRQVLGTLPAYTIASPRDLAGAVAGAVDGIALQSLVLGESPRAALHTVEVMVLSVIATAHTVAGETPPLDRLRELLRRGDRAGG